MRSLDGKLHIPKSELTGRPKVASWERQSSEVLVLTKGAVTCPPQPPPPCSKFTCLGAVRQLYTCFPKAYWHIKGLKQVLPGEQRCIQIGEELGKGIMEEGKGLGYGWREKDTLFQNQGHVREKGPGHTGSPRWPSKEGEGLHTQPLPTTVKRAQAL